MAKLNVGMIGAGFVGQLAHLMNLTEIADCNLLALAELKPELCSRVAARFGIPKTYPDHTHLLADPEIDAVVVVLPRHFTGPVVLDCLNAGKHVLSEKPMAGSLLQGKILLDAAKANRVKYAVGYMKRYDGGVEVAKQALAHALQSGSLGSPIAVHATCNWGDSYCNAYGHIATQESAISPFSPWSLAPDWLPEEFHPKFGSYLNIYSHMTNLLRYLFDATPSIEYVNLTEHKGQLAVLRFPQFLATLQTGKMSHPGWSEEIKMTFVDGEITLSLPAAFLRNVPASLEIYRAKETPERVRPSINWSWAFRRQSEAFIQDVLQDRPMRNAADEAYRDIVLIEAMWKREMERSYPCQT